jgi:hypothetical protein
MRVTIRSGAADHFERRMLWAIMRMANITSAAWTNVGLREIVIRNDVQRLDRS